MPPPKQSSSTLPKNWPAHLPYLRTPSHSPSLTAAHLSSLRTKPPDALEIPTPHPSGPYRIVRINTINDPAHPATGQRGLFAARHLQPGTFVLEYLGVLHASRPATSRGPDIPSPEPTPEETARPPADPHSASDYDLSLDRDSGVAIDAAARGNEARFMNDYRGIAERPNAEFREVWHAGRGERGMAVWVLPGGKSGKGKGIGRGEEIVVSYGRGFWGARREGGGEGGG